MVRNSVYPSFEESMKYSSFFKNPIDNTKWDILRNRYDNWLFRTKGENQIPKILHQVWIGGPLPAFEQQMTDQVRQKLGADWEYIMWTEHDLHRLNDFKNKELFDITPNLGQKSDLLRYAILNEFGGIYMDTDFLLLTDFNDLLDLEFFCGVAYDAEPTVFNGLMGSTPGNNIIKDLLTLDIDLCYSDATDIMNSTGPYFLTRQIFKNISTIDNLVVFPNSYFYPLPNFEINQVRGKDHQSYLEPESICCHMWSSSWM